MTFVLIVQKNYYCFCEVVSKGENMQLHCIATGSTGNCYTLTSSSRETLILDCGISIKEIKKGLDWNIKDVVGVICG